ncbi:MAG: Gfo/Idh/MocA family oxidoreductase [Oscillospiraceae bacterium]|jgi:predicted dehydrogenase|nr:Gfo/Idh/MocA family oxidoreductase [Oscillospiraceae bacterium]
MKLLIVGMGLRASVMLKEMRKLEPDLEVCAVCDPDPAARDRLAEAYTGEARFFGNLTDALDWQTYDGAMLATRCNLHTELASLIMERNLPLFFEKPVGISESQIAALENAAKSYTSQAVCSFPLRVSPLCTLAREIVLSGALGEVEQAQAVNNVPYGGVYYHNWYRDDSVTGGLWLQKATHDFDYAIFLLGRQPAEICAMDAKRVFSGSKPAGLLCKDCEEYRTCPESPYVLKNIRYEEVTGEYCCFGEDVGNQDSGSALLRFDTGMHMAYSQNFYARKAAAKRGIRLLGTRGTLEFDWYAGELAVYSHEMPKVERHSFDAKKMGHFGGDRALAGNFLDVVRGGESAAPLGAGILSAKVCLAAEKSSRENRFVAV